MLSVAPEYLVNWTAVQLKITHLEAQETWKAFRIQVGINVKAESGDEVFLHAISEAKGTETKTQSVAR